MWKIQKIISKGDYNYALVWEHPKATKNGYVLLHRIVMENHLGRLLNPNEVVHHINKQKKDNRIENLELLNCGVHLSEHAIEKGKLRALLKCPQCSTIFSKRIGQTFLMKGSIFTACSNSCRGRFSRMMQLYGRTYEVEKAILGNFLTTYRKFPIKRTTPREPANNGTPRDYTPSTCDGKDIVQPASL